MDIYHLPQDIVRSRDTAFRGILIQPYTAPQGSFRGRSMLHSNAISLVISGKKTMHFAEKVVRIQDDEFHFLSAGNCLVSMDLSEETVFRSILIFFDNQVLADFYRKYEKLIQTKRASLTISTEPYVAFRKDAFTRQFIESLTILTQLGGAISEEMKQLKLEELLLYLLTTNPQTLLSFQSVPQTDGDDWQLRKAVEANLTSPVSIEELAFLCNTSVSTFKRRFFRVYGTSPSRWLLHRRMELAKELLGQYRQKPSEVYHQVGYESHSSFSQSFRQVVGLTPKAFQRQELNVHQQLLIARP
ncbi:helix-turn-helix domain-containing protein [Larkinella bovis]|uniref:Helix-turn-helix domain-containing protein n=1 Tax=Larkinella bovis TaxID=683041 RepID=A0ABW0ICK9_9BACT